MGLEIERKYLLENTEWKDQIEKSIQIKQGYLNSHKERTTRVRIKGKSGFITIKGKTTNATRLEYEYEIPLKDASELLNLCEQPIISKIRHHISYRGKLWEIDVFQSENEGLVVAEIELESESEKFDMPLWIGKEVTSDNKYYNSNLVQHPYKNW